MAQHNNFLLLKIACQLSIDECAWHGGVSVESGFHIHATYIHRYKNKKIYKYELNGMCTKIKLQLQLKLTTTKIYVEISVTNYMNKYVLC